MLWHSEDPAPLCYEMQWLGYVNTSGRILIDIGSLASWLHIFFQSRRRKTRFSKNTREKHRFNSVVTKVGSCLCSAVQLVLLMHCYWCMFLLSRNIACDNIIWISYHMDPKDAFLLGLFPCVISPCNPYNWILWLWQHTASSARPHKGIVPLSLSCFSHRSTIL